MTENFCLDKVKTLSPTEAKQYVDKFFIPLTDGNHALLVNGKYDIYDESVIRKTYFKRMSQELNKYYFQDKTDLRTITYDINKPALYEKFLNLCPKIKATYKNVNEFSPEVKTKLQTILKYMKDVFCSNRDDSYNFLLKWFANMIRGNRNDSALYLKSIQGVGKSSLLEFIRKYVLGNQLCYQGGSGPIKNKFNAELSGKLMVMFEELENFNKTEWMAISSVLKRQITSPTLQIERKGQDVREETNFNNYILLSNNDAIQDDDGRRYFILDVSTKYLGDEEYFNKIYACFNDEVGQIFYSYLMDISLDGYNAQSYPVTKSKLDSYSKRLDLVYKFLKDEFILCRKDIKRQTVQELYEHYVNYCDKNALKPKNKIDFNTTLSNIGIKWKPSNCQNVYKVSYEELKAIADKFHWIHELDEYKKDNTDEEDEPIDDKAVVVRVEEHKKIVDTKNTHIDKLTENNCMLQTDLLEAMKYIKELESRIYKVEEKQEPTEKKPTKKQPTKQTDIVEIAEGVFLNKATNEEYIAETFEADEDDFFN